MALKDMELHRIVDTSVLVKKVENISCSNGKNAVFFTVSTKDEQFVAKMWDSPVIQAELYEGKVMSIYGSVSEYKGVREVKLSSYELTGESPLNYIQSLDIDTLSNDFMNFLKKHLSENYYNVLRVVFKEVGYENFVKGYAATEHHDNIVGGLLHHTFKMLKIAEVVIANNHLEFMANRIYTGIVLHDIGKIRCYTPVGGVTDEIFVDHKAFGIEILSRVSSEITPLIGVDEYNHLLAIILGHHGDYGEPCRTVATKIIHLIDALDAVVTGMESDMKCVDYKGDIKCAGVHLKI